MLMCSSKDKILGNHSLEGVCLCAVMYRLFEVIFPAYFLEMNNNLSTILSLPLVKLNIFWLTNALSTGSVLLNKNMTRPGEMECLTLICILKINKVHLTEQGNAKLASSILATINGNITPPVHGNSSL